MYVKSKVSKVSLLLLVLYLSGCASVPMSSPEEDSAKKQFSPPSKGKSGLYIFRDSNFGGALKKSVYIDGEFIGETAPKTYFYREINEGKHELSTESEFGNNDLVLVAKKGLNYFVRQFIKFGVFVGGAGLELVSEDEGKKGVLESKLAK